MCAVGGGWAKWDLALLARAGVILRGGGAPRSCLQSACAGYLYLDLGSDGRLRMDTCKRLPGFTAQLHIHSPELPRGGPDCEGATAGFKMRSLEFSI